MSDNAAEPITVSTSPAADQATALVRQIMMIMGGALTANGTFSQSAWQMVTGVALALAPLVHGQLAVRLRATQLATLAKDPAVSQVQPAVNQISTVCKLVWAVFCSATASPNEMRTITMTVPAVIADALTTLEAVVNPLVAENASLKTQVATLTAQLSTDTATATSAAQAAAAQDDSDAAAAIQTFTASLPQPTAGA